MRGNNPFNRIYSDTRGAPNKPHTPSFTRTRTFIAGIHTTRPAIKKGYVYLQCLFPRTLIKNRSERRGRFIHRWGQNSIWYQTIRRPWESHPETQCHRKSRWGRTVVALFRGKPLVDGVLQFVCFFLCPPFIRSNAPQGLVEFMWHRCVHVTGSR